jgi:MoxR-like ATPase
VRAHVYDVLRHRIGLTYEAEAEGKTVTHIIQEIIDKIHLP